MERNAHCHPQLNSYSRERTWFRQMKIPGRMLKMSASFVLASLRGSRRTRPPHHAAARTSVVLLIRRTVRPRGYASPLRSLRPRWTAILSILRQSSAIVLLDRVHHGHILCHRSSRTPTGLSPNLSAYGVTSTCLNRAGGCGFSHSYDTMPTLPIAKKHFFSRKT